MATETWVLHTTAWSRDFLESDRRDLAEPFQPSGFFAGHSRWKIDGDFEGKPVVDENDATVVRACNG